MRLPHPHYDCRRGTPLTVWQKIKWYWEYPYWCIIGRLAQWGFFTTEEGAYIRLRDFTPFFWRTMILRELDQVERIYKNVMAMHVKTAVLAENKRVLDILDRSFREQFPNANADLFSSQILPFGEHQHEPLFLPPNDSQS